ncbi:amidase [Mycolicibacterium vaccae]|jgi:Asp-tRNA(Asn)/Glu-tRNA(Gln) amidotransferase A subunit family amidase|nr:amidase [Mycolicibacterium vaccae]ANI42943.1 amidase [Mycolicibacterium vaccae 95051]
MSTELHYMSAVDLLKAFGEKSISPLEALEAVQVRAAEVEPGINALIERDWEDHTIRARASTERYAAGAPLGPLDGLPVVVKEEHPMAGREQSSGSMVVRDTAAETHPVPERMINAGAIVHARTTTPEFACATTCFSDKWGVTRNPWNRDYTPGGSSGGSAAALASGTAYLASASDMGGSIRVPASFSGVIGFKAPYGRVPSMPPYGLSTYCHEGPMARTVEDVVLFQNVIQGQHHKDPISLPSTAVPADLGDVRGLKVAYALTLGDYVVEPEIAANTQRFADVLADAGADVTEVTVPVVAKMVFETLLAHFDRNLTEYVDTACRDDGDYERLMPYTRHIVELCREAGSRISPLQGITREAEIQAAVLQVFESHDALICPTVGAYGYLADDSYLDGIETNGHRFHHYLETALTPVFNIASRHPVLNVPSGLAPNGVPTGVQVVARPYDDVTAFRVGAAAERALGIWMNPEWRPNI